MVTMWQLLLICTVLTGTTARRFIKGIPVMSNTIPEIPADSIGVVPFSDHFPFRVGKEYRPKKKQTKRGKLRRRLGNDYDADWMSVEQPVMNDIPTYRHDINEDLLTELELVEQDLLRADGLSNMGNETLSAIKTWLLKKASCQVQYRWQDLGELFWPRFVKTGSCLSEGSCSWPTGMLCTISENKRIKLLRWHCKRRRRKSRRQNNHSRTKRLSIMKPTVFRRIVCKWIKIEYFITDDCVCKC